MAARPEGDREEVREVYPAGVLEVASWAAFPEGGEVVQSSAAETLVGVQEGGELGDQEADRVVLQRHLAVLVVSPEGGVAVKLEQRRLSEDFLVCFLFLLSSFLPPPSPHPLPLRLLQPQGLLDQPSSAWQLGGRSSLVVGAFLSSVPCHLLGASLSIGIYRSKTNGSMGVYQQ